MQKMIDLRRIVTRVRLTREELLDSEYGAFCARTLRRQKAAKEALVKRGITPRVKISGAYVPPAVVRNFTYVNVGGVQ